MRDGISGGPVPEGYRYAAPINAGAAEFNVSPLVMYAIACNESIIGEVNGKWDAATVLSEDGGHGLFQLTSSWPTDDWQDPAANARYAALKFIAPDWQYWADDGLQGEDLVRAIAASFNAGLTGAEEGHSEGDVDKYTTDHYAARALAIYQKLVAGEDPFS